MTFLDDAIKLVRDWEASRPRSQQAEVGWSEVGGCRAHMGYRLDGAWASDETDNWAAVRGTAIHQLMEEIMSAPGMATEVTTAYRGIPGHADLVVETDSVTDLKTKTLASSRMWQERPETFRQARIQIHGYAAGLINDGRLPGDCTVRILVVPVDGKFSDWWCWEEPFDRSLADEGVARLEQVRAHQAQGVPLPKDKDYAWCADYCEFFSICRSQDDPREAEVVADPEAAAAVAAYGEAHERWSAADKDKKRLAPLIRGLHGSAHGWRVSMSRPGDSEQVPDVEAMEGILAAEGIPVPMTTKPGAAPRLNVRRVKGAAA